MEQGGTPWQRILRWFLVWSWSIWECIRSKLWPWNNRMETDEHIDLSMQVPRSNSLSSYVVVARAQASAILPQDQKLSVSYRFGNQDPINIVFCTRFLEKGFDLPIPEDLWVEATGVSNSLSIASEQFSNGMADICNVLAISTNAYMGRLEVELAFDTTKDVREREYCQRFVEGRPITQVPGRVLPVPATIAVMDALVGHVDKNRLMRAVSQYSLALEDWSPGSELLCVVHLFMGIEALKPIAVRQHLLETGLTKESLGQLWGYVHGRRESLVQFLEHEARKRLLFEGDMECHRKAKYVSDNFEHGLDNFGNLHVPAKEAVVATAKYLRQAILKFMGLNEETNRLLFSPPYQAPRGPLKLIKFLRGRILSNANNLAAPGQEYPIIHWESSLAKVVRNEDGGYSFSPTETFAPQLGIGVSFRPESFEVWDGSTLQEQRQPPMDL